MARYIDADAYAFPGDLINEPTADVVEVKHAEWIEDGYNGNPFVCSFCGHEGCYSGEFHNKQYFYTNYCHLICRIDDRIYNCEAETYQEARQQAIDCWNTRTPKERGGEK